MSALRQTLDMPHLSPTELQFLRTVADDTEDAPWMVMNDGQFWGASGLAWCLENHARTHGLPWYVGGMLPLTYLPAGARRRKQVAPDVLVAFIASHRRDSLRIEEEGMPPFVLEVVSGSSVKRDLIEKTELYRLLGAREYAIARLDLASPRLEGYRRGERDAWSAWLPDREGRLWSTVLDLGLVLLGDEVRAVTWQGDKLRTLPEETEAREQAEAAHRQAQAAQRRAQAAQRRAEEENARLREEIARLTRAGDEAPGDSS